MRLLVIALTLGGLLTGMPGVMSLATAADDAAAYLDQVERRIMAVWKMPPNAKGLKVVIRLRLERSGRVSDVRVEKSSGDKQVDTSAVQAARRASPFPPVPDSAQSSLVGDLRIVLDPTRPVPEQAPGQKTPAHNAPEQRIDPRILTQRIYQVPLVVNQELAQARATLKDAGFASESIALNDAPGRRIVERSEPEAGARFPASARPVVKLYHRAQKPPGGDVQQQRMPNLYGTTCAEAQARVAALHRRLSSCDVGSPVSGSTPARINRQEPLANSVLSANAVLRAWTEPDSVLVPAVRGLAVNDAVVRIKQAGLRAAFNTSGVDRWHYVQAQDPDAGVRVAPQSGVRLSLVARYVVPDLTGRSCAQAQALVSDAGLGALQCWVEAGLGNPPSGRIHRQFPAPKTMLSAVKPVQAWEQPTLVVVPNVLGQPEAAATAVLAQRNLRAVLSGPGASAGRRVATQSPPGGASVLPGRNVALTLDLSVPPLNGLDCEGARARARAHGFDTLNCERKLASPAQALHRIFEQTPPAGTRLAAAQPLQAALAIPVAVPNVVGQGLAQALGTLDQAMLKARPDARDGDRDVVTQKPGAGAEVAPGTVVGLSTQRYERVPAVIGLHLPEAQARLAQSNFAASPDHNDRATSRKVDRQVPADGERLPVGRAVQLLTHVEVAVPDVLKQRLPAASAALAQSGLRAKPDRDDNATDREVRAQRPAARTLVPEQSEVALDTMRLVTVPALAGISCKAAGELVSKAGLRFGGCNVQSVLPLVLGEATVSEQSLSANAVVDEGTSITAQAQPPRWSAPALVLLMGAALSALGLRVAKKIWPPKPRTPLSPVQPPPPTLLWRVAPDRSPGCSLRLASGSDDESPTSGSLPRIRWRVVSEAPLTCLRSSEALEGNNHDHQD